MIKKVFLSILIGLILNVNIVNAANCDALLTAEAYDFIMEILGYVRIAVPILLILLCSGDLASIVISQDDNASKKATSRIVRRFIAAAAFFFVPLIVSVLLGIDAVKNSLNLVDDPTCGIATDSVNTEETEDETEEADLG